MNKLSLAVTAVLEISSRKSFVNWTELKLLLNAASVTTWRSAPASLYCSKSIFASFYGDYKTKQKHPVFHTKWVKLEVGESFGRKNKPGSRTQDPHATKPPTTPAPGTTVKSVIPNLPYSFCYKWTLLSRRKDRSPEAKTKLSWKPSNLFENELRECGFIRPIAYSNKECRSIDTGLYF